MKRIQTLLFVAVATLFVSTTTIVLDNTTATAIESKSNLCKKNPKKGVKNTNACKKGYDGAVNNKKKTDICKNYKGDEKKSCEWGFDQTKAAITAENGSSSPEERGKEGAENQLPKAESCAGLSGNKRKSCEKAWTNKVKEMGKAEGAELAASGAEDDSGCNSLGYGGNDAKKACKNAFKEDKAKTGNARFTCGKTGTFFDFGNICDGADSEAGGTNNPIFVVLLGLVNILAFGVGIAVVGGIVYGGILYTSARDNSGQTQKAISIIATSVVSLIAFALLFAVINFIVPGGLIN